VGSTSRWCRQPLLTHRSCVRALPYGSSSAAQLTGAVPWRPPAAAGARFSSRGGDGRPTLALLRRQRRARAVRAVRDVRSCACVRLPWAAARCLRARVHATAGRRLLKDDAAALLRAPQRRRVPCRLERCVARPRCAPGAHGVHGPQVRSRCVRRPSPLSLLASQQRLPRRAANACAPSASSRRIQRHHAHRRQLRHVLCARRPRGHTGSGRRCSHFLCRARGQRSPLTPPAGVLLRVCVLLPAEPLRCSA
jgi:hypothetical protein